MSSQQYERGLKIINRFIEASYNLADAERDAGEKIGMVGCLPPSIAQKLNARKVEFELEITDLIVFLQEVLLLNEP